MDKIKLSFIIGFASFFTWGSLPVFWQLLFYLPPGNIVAYRIICSLAVVILFITVTKRWKHVIAIFHHKRSVAVLFTCGIIMCSNWLLFIASLSMKHVMEVSIGYYINPLLNALCGAIFFKESLRPLQKLSILFAAAGVLYMIIGYGKIPVFALLLAGTFAMYGAVHKMTKVNVIDGMFFEMLILFAPAVIYMLKYQAVPFYAEPVLNQIIILMVGPFTAIPLIGFAFSVQNLRLATVGMLQYISPTATFILSILFFKEKFSPQMAIVFTGVWLGVLTYCIDAILSEKKRRKQCKAKVNY